METITAQLKRRIAERDNFTCGYCGEKVLENYHIDHIIPRSKGGSNFPENLITACEECNVRKKAIILKSTPTVKPLDLIEGDIKNTDYGKVQGFRLTKDVYDSLKAIKKKGQAWNFLFEYLVECYHKQKELKKLK